MSDFKDLKIDKISSFNHRILNNLTARNIINNSSPKPAIFFDRDGVIIKDCHYISKPEKVEILKGVKEIMIYAKRIGFLIIVVTNQSGITREFLTWDDYEKVTLRMLSHIGKPFLIDGIYANSNSPEIREEKKCWRKPNPNMIFAAKEDFNLDLGNSIIIGDRLTDLVAGKNAGIRRFVHVMTGHGENERENIKKEFSGSSDTFDLFLINNLLEFPLRKLKID